jgi:hypothetical protein
MELDQRSLEAYLTQLSGAPVHIEQVSELGGGASGAAALKAFGYGRPICIDYRRLIPDAACNQDADLQRVVLHRVNRNEFGHEHHADCIAEIWLAFTTFNQLPGHVGARDLVALSRDGRLESAGHLADLLLLTDYAPGTLYADDLLRVRDAGMCSALDIARAEALASYLADIHAVKHVDPLLWRRRLRDLVGHGEGIMGLADSYPSDFPLVSASELCAIETAANAWRWRLKPLAARLSQVHGDFHPFNILFTDQTTFTVLDRSRGAWGEPADDVSCLAINYLFFSLQRSGELGGSLQELYTAFWQRYLTQSQDHDLLNVIQPWFAWRALVLASPQWYPTLDPAVRRKLLTFAQQVLTVQHFAWPRINDYLEA